MAEKAHTMPATRAEARHAGAVHYFTGNACSKGHVAARYVSTADCIVCSDDRRRRQQAEKPERMRAYRAKWAEANPDKAAASMQKHLSVHADRRKDMRRAWKQANKAKVRASSRDSYKKNMARRSADAKRWRLANPEKFADIQQRSRAKRKFDPKYQLTNSIRSGIVRGLQVGVKGRRKTFDLLGYSIEHLMAHLEALFQPGMNWANYGRLGWEVDHVIPLKVFNYSAPDHADFKRAWALDNLQPLWRSDNAIKSAKLLHPFQPSLAL
jgi:hypothetical protein